MMRPDQQVRARVSGLTWKKVADDQELVILDLDNSEYLTLNVTGAFLWELLVDGPASVEELTAGLCAEFEVDWDTARRDVEDFLTLCERESLLDSSGTD